MAESIDRDLDSYLSTTTGIDCIQLVRLSCVAQNVNITINISPLRGGHPPEPIDMPFGVLSGVPDVITHAKFCVNRLRGFSVAAPQKVPFPILF